MEGMSKTQFPHRVLIRYTFHINFEKVTDNPNKFVFTLNDEYQSKFYGI